MKLPKLVRVQAEAERAGAAVAAGCCRLAATWGLKRDPSVKWPPTHHFGLSGSDHTDPQSVDPPPIKAIRLHFRFRLHLFTYSWRLHPPVSAKRKPEFQC